MATKESVNNNFSKKIPFLLSLISLTYLVAAGYSDKEILSFKLKRRKDKYEDIKKSQDNRCFDCGMECELEIHHRVPKSKGGNGNRRNLIALGTSIKDGGCGCHDKWDEEALS